MNIKALVEIKPCQEVLKQQIDLSLQLIIRGACPKNIATPREAVAGVITVARTVPQPFGIADPYRPNISPTRWGTVSDLTNRMYYFESTTSPNIIWVRLDELDFENRAPVKKIDLVNDTDRVGNVSSQFKNAEPIWLGQTNDYYIAPSNISQYIFHRD
jgi:hypothetical protein